MSSDVSSGYGYHMGTYQCRSLGRRSRTFSGRSLFHVNMRSQHPCSDIMEEDSNISSHSNSKSATAMAMAVATSQPQLSPASPIAPSPMPSTSSSPKPETVDSSSQTMGCQCFMANDFLAPASQCRRGCKGFLTMGSVAKQPHKMFYVDDEDSPLDEDEKDSGNGSVLEFPIPMRASTIECGSEIPENVEAETSFLHA